MSQQERRRDLYPWTWEPAAATTAVLAALLVVAVQVGRAAANLAAGGELQFPPTAAGWLTSTPAVLTGHATGGLLPTVHAAGPTLLGGSIAVTAALLLGLGLTTTVAALRRWGPGHLHGCASRAEVRNTLGLARLRRSRHLLRPDLYPSHAPDQERR